MPSFFKGYKVNNLDLKKHIFPIISLFVPQIAVKLYNIIDKIMIGYIITNKSELGNYEEAYKLINLLFTIVSCLGVVVLPRIANTFALGDNNKLEDYLKKTFRFTFFLAFPIMFGIIIVSNEFVPIFLGTEYVVAVKVVKSLAPMILLCGITNIIGNGYLLPTKKQKQYTISILAGLVVNVIFNLKFIKIYGANGAAIVTIISQFVVLLVQIYFVKNELNIFKMFITGKKYFIASLIMLIISNLFNDLSITNLVFLLVLKVIIGIVSYFLILVILKDKYIDEIISYIKKVLKLKFLKNEKY